MAGAGELDVHIDTLSIDGIPLSRSQRGELLEAVELEVARLLGSDRAPMNRARAVSLPRVEGAPIAASSDPRALGNDIAASVVEAVTR